MKSMEIQGQPAGKQAFNAKLPPRQATRDAECTRMLAFE